MADPHPAGGTGGQSRRVIFIDLARALATVFMGIVCAEWGYRRVVGLA